MGEDGLNMELYSQNGVLVEDIKPYKNDIDFHNNPGTISIVECNSDVGKCIEWHQCDVSIESHDQEWAIVQDINNYTEGFSDDARNTKKPIIQMDIENLIRVKVVKKNYKLIVEGSGQKVTFYFENGNADTFVKCLKRIIGPSMRENGAGSYFITNQKEVQALEKSFAELELFTDDQTRSTIVWNFVKRLHDNPYITTMDTFSKVSNVLLYRPPYQCERVTELPESNDETTDSNTRASSEGYEFVTKGPPLPPRTFPSRGAPLDWDQWRSFCDNDGRISDPKAVQQIVFRGGIVDDESLKEHVWKFLLGYYPWRSTGVERQLLEVEKAEQYARMKQQWQSMSPDQIDRFGSYRMRISLIEKDVHRTDRHLPFYAGDDNPNLDVLENILRTYVMYNFDLGYVQGMSDLLSPLLKQFEDEAETFWCFVGFMDRVSGNFELDQEHMKRQLQQLYSLLCVMEPQLASFLDQDSKNMSFCFRWLLVWFKREFTYKDIYSLWEVLWTDYVKNYHLFICAAILVNEKDTIMLNNYGFAEILKHVNDLANTMDLEEILRRAEGMYLQFKNASNVPYNVRNIFMDPKEVNNQAPKLKSCMEDERELLYDQSIFMQFH